MCLNIGQGWIGFCIGLIILFISRMGWYAYNLIGDTFLLLSMLQDSASFRKPVHRGDTTGAGCFAEGPRLSAKPLRPSAKPLPSAVLGKAPSAKIRSAKASLPRAVYRALGARQSGKKMQKKSLNFFLVRGGAHWQVTTFFSQNSRLHGRQDSNSWPLSHAIPPLPPVLHTHMHLYVVSVTQILY
jgi:hypothetical protein